MSRTPNPDLLDFVNWLIGARLLRRRTAQVYASHVRHTLGGLPDFEQETIDAYFTNLVGTTRYGPRKTAWKKFVEWAYEEKEVEVPFPAGPSIAPELPPLPDKVREVLSHLSEFFGRDLPIYSFADVYWAHVSCQPGGQYQIESPLEALRFIIEESSWIETLRDYAQPPEDGSIPLIPIEPGSPIPYPAQGLRREVRTYRNAR